MDTEPSTERERRFRVALQLYAAPLAPTEESSSRSVSSVLIEHIGRIPEAEPLCSTDELQTLITGRDRVKILRNRLLRLPGDHVEHINRALFDLGNAELVTLPTLGSIEPGPLRLCFRRDGSTFEITHANHALAALLSLLVDVEACFASEGDRVICLDEPELHLHPKSQAKLAMKLVRRARETRTQLVFATHSLEMCDQLMRLSDATVQVFREPLTSPTPIGSKRDLRKAFSRTHNLALLMEPGTPGPQDGFGSLNQLLMKLFTEEELRRFVALSLGRRGGRW